MAWQDFAPFTSSTVAAARYDAEQLLLEIEFHNGGRYHYFDVPEHVAQACDQAESKGQFLAVSIKGHYRYSRA
ncbi:KTSC domain-containing protein [Sphingomonas psychrotolerans]|uniref:KTSC domain-containing protein n=1 Tax=Sphingomonas psychrotolerans TaxID=1327635 RepID=A0ABU3N2G6_9SPHN|nr:KTSC domain-containing protein [Sphingomonas psychrotolerans]MDT8758749.1 KTSC domain-containing protein [Sphingomonas psychrotolerans]